VLSFCFFSSAAEELHFVLGDADGFGLGLGLGDGEERPASGGFFDARDEGDLSFTDARPAEPSRMRDCSSDYRFGTADRTIVGASLRLLTLGVHDGDFDVAGSDKDLRLFLDGVEIAGAFDDVDQFVFFDKEPIELVGLVEIAIPEDTLRVLFDGHVEVRMRNTDLERRSSGDAFAIDYSELVIDVLDGLQIPGDCDQDGVLGLTDGLCLFGYLFRGTPATLPCAEEEASVALLDLDSDGILGLSDGVLLLEHLFRGGRPHPLGATCRALPGCQDSCSL
jgi:hypothetical protein